MGLLPAIVLLCLAGLQLSGITGTEGLWPEVLSASEAERSCGGEDCCCPPEALVESCCCAPERAVPERAVEAPRRAVKAVSSLRSPAQLVSTQASPGEVPAALVSFHCSGGSRRHAGAPASLLSARGAPDLQEPIDGRARRADEGPQGSRVPHFRREPPTPPPELFVRA